MSKSKLTRKKLLKLIDKAVEYTATIGRFQGTRALLLDIHYDGKLICDHAWVSATKALLIHEVGEEVMFTATAYTYKDKQNVRKHGLTKCHNYTKYNKEAIETLLRDKEEAGKRCRK